jgi:hypothetical protein
VRPSASSISSATTTTPSCIATRLAISLAISIVHRHRHQHRASPSPSRIEIAISRISIGIGSALGDPTLGNSASALGTRRSDTRQLGIGPRHSAIRHSASASEIRQLGNLAAWRVRDNAAPLYLPPCRFTLFCRQSPATKPHDAAPTTHAAWAAPWSLFFPHHRVRCLILFARDLAATAARHLPASIRKSAFHHHAGTPARLQQQQAR